MIDPNNAPQPQQTDPEIFEHCRRFCARLTLVAPDRYRCDECAVLTTTEPRKN